MIIRTKHVERKIKAGRALVASAEQCNDEEIGLTLQSFRNLMDTLEYYVKIRRRCGALETAIIACKESNDSGEVYASPTADSAQALANLFEMVD